MAKREEKGVKIMQC